MATSLNLTTEGRLLCANETQKTLAQDRCDCLRTERAQLRAETSDSRFCLGARRSWMPVHLSGKSTLPPYYGSHMQCCVAPCQVQPFDLMKLARFSTAVENL